MPAKKTTAKTPIVTLEGLAPSERIAAEVRNAGTRNKLPRTVLDAKDGNVLVARERAVDVSYALKEHMRFLVRPGHRGEGMYAEGKLRLVRTALDGAVAGTEDAVAERLRAEREAARAAKAPAKKAAPKAEPKATTAKAPAKKAAPAKAKRPARTQNREQAQERLDRINAAKEEAKAAKAAKAAGEPRPPTPNLDALEAERRGGAAEQTA